MVEFKRNEYIKILNPIKNNYRPVRILEKTHEGYSALDLATGKNVVVYDYQLEAHGYKHIWITQEFLISLGFKQNGLIYEIGNIVVWEGIIGKCRKGFPPGQDKFFSKFIGFFVFETANKTEFEKEFSEIDFDSDVFTIKEKYFYTSKANELLDYLIDHMPDKFSYRKFDELVLLVDRGSKL